MDFAKLFGAIELDGVLPILAKSERACHALEKALGRKRGKKAVEMLRSGTLEGELGDEIYDHFLEELENEAEWVSGAETYHPEDPDNYDYIFPIEIREYEGVFMFLDPSLRGLDISCPRKPLTNTCLRVNTSGRAKDPPLVGDSAQQDRKHRGCSEHSRSHTGFRDNRHQRYRWIQRTVS